jgi:hypothetical protein
VHQQQQQQQQQEVCGRQLRCLLSALLLLLLLACRCLQHQYSRQQQQELWEGVLFLQLLHLGHLRHLPSSSSSRCLCCRESLLPGLQGSLVCLHLSSSRSGHRPGPSSHSKCSSKHCSSSSSSSRERVASSALHSTCHMCLRQFR